MSDFLEARTGAAAIRADERAKVRERVEAVRKDEEYLNQYMVRNRVIDEILTAINEEGGTVSE